MSRINTGEISCQLTQRDSPFSVPWALWDFMVAFVATGALVWSKNLGKRKRGLNQNLKKTSGL